jgi:hypothetical protein
MFATVWRSSCGPELHRRVGRDEVEEQEREGRDPEQDEGALDHPLREVAGHP